jgi:hypothetical protein
MEAVIFFETSEDSNNKRCRNTDEDLQNTVSSSNTVSLMSLYLIRHLYITSILRKPEGEIIKIECFILQIVVGMGITGLYISIKQGVISRSFD